MPGYQSPKKCWLHIVVSMNNSIACGNYGPSIRNFDSWINFSNPINSLSHYLRFALYDTFAHYILLKQIISVWEVDKTALHVVYGIQNIL